ncbi:putative methyltransferase PMT2 [Apostasia shenzhenica]|uniref:Putative methyltransferase PMT2 n=1 Tax=Apostasia shenzhenica TaxID=1088818 RepID=A0A2I0AMB7_9ASPA|nr:putative methyltransferase PMT2 [Apostasia shenzhenica]
MRSSKARRFGAWSSLRLSRIMAVLQYILGIFVIFVSLASLHRFYSAGVFLPANDSCEKFHTVKDGYADFDIMALSDRVDEVLNQLLNLQDKLEFTVRNMGKSTQPHFPAGKPISSSDLKLFLEEDVIQPLYSAYVALRLIRIPKPEEGADHLVNIREDPLINHFTVEEIRKYITQKGNRGGNLNIYGTNKTFNTIGHACVLMRKELEEYMNYDVGSYCKDDWNLAQTLMLGGCDPLPRRRCLARASKFYQRPLPINESLWQLPDDRNVRWSNYQCRDFKCLSSKNHKRGFSICTGCFEMEKEKMKWVKDTSLVEFLISDVLALKPGEIRIGLDVSTGTGSFAARMREWNVTIISTVLNIGAPFSEIISLRGLVPLYFSMNQRLPFFDNTLDLIHTNVFLAGWIDLLLLDFILFDWDRILRPGGLLWVDKFFCSRKDLDDYVYMFLQFRYRKHKWVVSFKSKDEVYLSALLEKPPRSL